MVNKNFLANGFFSLVFNLLLFLLLLLLEEPLVVFGASPQAFDTPTSSIPNGKI